jgi:hypothetical protein
MSFTLTWESGGVHRKFFGAVSIRERLDAFSRICADVRFDSLRFAITDYLEVTDYETTEAATEEIAAMHIAPLRTNPRIAIAAVATRADIQNAVRQFRGLQFTTQPYGLFSTEEAARLWIQAVTVRTGPLGRPWGY